jgi:hypothetical protein
LPKREIGKLSNFGSFQLQKVQELKINNSPDFYTWFPVCSQNIEG